MSAAVLHNVVPLPIFHRVSVRSDILDIKKIISSLPGCLSDEVYLDSILLLLANTRLVELDRD